MIETIKNHFKASIDVKTQAMETLPILIEKAAHLILNAFKEGKKVLTCGNGGSAGDAQHFSSEMLNRFEKERAPLPAIALTSDTLTLTAIANDYHYREVFSKQIQALGQPGDILLAYSTSGCSENILTAVKAAHEKKMSVIGVTGKQGGHLALQLRDTDIELRVPSESTARIQEIHLLITHSLCSIIEKYTD